MVSGIRAWLVPPTMVDEDESRLAGLLNTFLLVTLFADFVLVVAISLLDPQQLDRLWFIALFAPALLLMLVALRKGLVRPVAALFVCSLWIVVTVSTITGGGIRSPGFAAYPLVIMLAGFLLGRRPGLVFAGLSSLVGLILALAERVGDGLPPLSDYSSLGLWALFAAIFFFVAATLDLATRSIRDSLVRARKSERDYRLLMEQAADGIFISDAEGNLEVVNARCCELSGYTAAELLGMKVQELVPKESWIEKPLQLEGLWRGDGLLQERPLRRKDGKTILVEINASALSDGRIQAIVRDITERRQAEESLRYSVEEADRRQRLLLALSQAGQAIQRARTPGQIYQTIADEIASLGYQAAIFSVTDDGEYLSPTHATFRATTIEMAEKLTGLSMKTFRLPLAQGQAFQRLVMEQKATFTASAQEYIAEVVSGPVVDRLVELLDIKQAIGAPITIGQELLGLLFVVGEELKEVDAPVIAVLASQMGVALENARLYDEIRQQAQRLQQVLDTAPDGILLLDMAHRVQLANPAGEALLKALGGVGVGDVLTQLGGWELDELLKSDAVGRQELSLLEPRRSFEFSAQPLEGDLETAGWVLILHEITEEKERQEYQQAQERLATVGQLASGVAHDFNNILAVITLYSRLVLKTAELEPKNEERMAVVHDQAKRAASLIGQILDFSRRSLMERTSFAFLPFLKELIGLMERTLPENIVIKLASSGGHYVMEGDPARLQQVLMNLGLNARDAMPEGGELIIGLRDLKLRSGQRPPLPGLVPGDWLRLTVSDTGTGIKAEDLPHVFEPFFTTKPPGQGTGLGLSQVYGIVRQHGGHIDVASTPGQGTTVTIYLPVLKLTDTSPLDPSMLEGDPILGEGETVLVVEDDQATRQAVRDTLESLGYQVLEAADGEEALEVYAEHNRSISLVLSDLVMPGMGGGPLFRALRARDPELKIVVMTGYPLEESGQELLQQGVVAWLAKPFTAGAVGEAVHKALAGEV